MSVRLHVESTLQYSHVRIAYRLNLHTCKLDRSKNFFRFLCLLRANFVRFCIRRMMLSFKQIKIYLEVAPYMYMYYPCKCLLFLFFFDFSSPQNCSSWTWASMLKSRKKFKNGTSQICYGLLCRSTRKSLARFLCSATRRRQNCFWFSWCVNL